MITDNFKGLTDQEVANNRQQYGTNATHTVTKSRLWQVIKEIVTEPLFAILVCAALIYFILAQYQEGIIMLVALGFVSGISLYQENKSRNAVDALKKLAAPLTKVIRNGISTEIASEDLVMNDTILVEDGSLVPADAIVIEAHDFSVNESILTGEALSISKDQHEPNNNILQGTLVMSGWCVAQVQAIGKQTSLGKIGQTLQNIEVTKTPLQEQIKTFVRSMVAFGIVAFFIVWGMNYYTSHNILHSLLHGLTLAMSVLPEEIPVAFSTFMALGAYHLYKQKVIARSPHTVETLGAATVICTDKTGTITENNMQLAAIYDFKTNKIYDYTKQTINFNEVLEYAMWSSEPEPFDMMEKAIHQAYATTTPTDERPNYTLIHEYPLGGKPPIMTHVFSNKTHHIVACKGSVEGVLMQSELTHHQKKNIEHQTKVFASLGYRILGVGISDHDVDNLPKLQHDLSFDFVGLIAFYDPPKANMHQILEQFYDAGIEVKMITGDYAETALAIANQIKLKNSKAVLTGNEVMGMTQKQLLQKVGSVNVYARMFPDAKLKVIEALKANNEVVAMTGDGVNDGPALKAAHIGIAMGLRGSEMAKKAASLILMDDDLSHMVNAIALGRRIYENLKKAIQYIISIHIPIILIVTLPLVLFWKYTDFFSPIHVIFLELIMGPTCSIIFENEPIEANSMHKKPRKMSTSFFSFRELAVSMVQGLVITVACLGIGYYFMMQNNSQASVRTLIYTTLIFSNLFLTLANRSFTYSIFTTIRYKNNLLPIVLAVSLLVLFLSIYVHPVRNVFEFVELSPTQILICLATAFVGVMWIEVFKLLKPKNEKV
jgi:Ca2+-transporting ATPase